MTRVTIATIEALDWNCPQHITPRCKVAQFEELTQPLRKRVAELEKRLATGVSMGTCEFPIC